MAAMWFSANPGYNFYTIQLSHTFQVVLNILFTKQFGYFKPGGKNTKKKSTVAPAIPRIPQHTIAPGANVLP
jgi:hypothetical protein